CSYYFCNLKLQTISVSAAFLLYNKQLVLLTSCFVAQKKDFLNCTFIKNTHKISCGILFSILVWSWSALKRALYICK
ncbi:hypothetical protein, partial [Bacillus thuringiensis]|uniref:hypothetical protein n=1 Tax=Bacillus thuringiensis TaxID=1428 RepID=UPI001C3EF6DA